ncbi:MAG: indole-3-glycerol phosphate synthase TrpC [Verrucomicrobia bacterium]|nr:MAG: indole-3-glycerol phosphate synthase TrpC [Verrucomicrobiota bacterium]
MSILDEILAHKRVEIAQRKAVVPVEKIRAQAVAAPVPVGFNAALRAVPIALIAEVKRRSPSVGIIRETFDPAAIARAYEQGGAQAISSLMDAKYFGGGEEQFHAVRAAVKLPLLYKEFVVDEWQIWHARALGTSAVLLIAAALNDADLTRFFSVCHAAGVEPLLEVHDAEEMRRAAASGAQLIGVNNRDLRTFKTTLETTFRLQQLAPANCTLISESGIHTVADVRRLRASGIHAVLVGESLLRQPDLEGAVRHLIATP